MTTNFKLKPIALAMIPILFAGGNNVALAEEESNADKKKKEQASVEVIEVVGYKGSIQRAINAKRLADGVQDSIFAEDIGKSTDQNIGDALSRITGVTVQEENGEGTRISVRGAGAHLNQISLNGVQLTSSLNGSGGSGSTADQSVDLSSFSSDILASINVIKTSSADHDEGSLGANVILRTVKPLLIDKDRRTLEVQTRYNQYADENSYKISGTFSEKFLDENLGIIVTGSKETSDTRRDQVSGDWLAPYEVVDIRPGGATSLQTGQQLTNTETQKALISRGTTFGTNIDSQERETMTAGIQFLPTETTDIQLDLSYSHQVRDYDSHSINVRKPNLDEGQRPNLETDPQHLWWTLDEENNTLVKAQNRFGSGGLSRRLGGNETKNKVATLKITQEITDDLAMDLTAGYSDTEFHLLPNASLSSATWNKIPLNVLEEVPLDLLEPVGYDCETGKCSIITATSPYIYTPGGTNDNLANFSSGGFNPLDFHANHLGNISKNEELSNDTNKSVFLDFDWAIDFAGLTEVEFGAKWSNRLKDVYTSYQQFSGAGTTVFDPITGKPISNGTSVSSIGVVDILAGQGLPVADFMQGLIDTSSGYDQSFLDGWGILDPNKAFSRVFDIPNVSLIKNDSGSRKIEQDNISAYAKVNFEYFDGRLTGNVGVRYVKTEVESFGNASANYFNGDRIFTPHEMIYRDGLANTNLAECTNEQSERPDLFGTGFEDPKIDCHEPRLFPTSLLQEDYVGTPILQVTYDDAGNVVSIDQNISGDSKGEGSRSWWWNYGHSDESTQMQHGQYLTDEGDIDDPQGIHLRQYDATGENKNEVWLPSLNLNYAFSDELIGRFATSKTMARPKFDSLRPGFSATENVWGDFSRATAYNPKLKPLESKNIDLSIEWYFDQTGMISLAYFRKDMTNFEESVRDRVYFKDLRRAYDTTTITIEDFILPFDESMTPMASECHPDRVVQNNLNNALPFACEEMELTVIRNGKGTLNQGIEFSYSQAYDFLPGVLSGLGTNFNYTYAKTESDAEVLELTGREIKAMPQGHTPLHSTNTTLYWEKSGHQLRLTHRFNSEQLISRGLTDGNSWQDSTSKLDFSATYKYDQNITFTFHALNLTDDITRTFYTSSTMNLGTEDEPIIFDEGNVLDGGVDQSKTIAAFKTGRNFRLSARINF